jgi:uncharacterized protein YegP (UPF0339 family)
MDPNGSKFILYRHLTASGLEYRWRLRDARGRTVAHSVAGYREKGDCEREMSLLMQSHPGASVRDLTAATSRRQPKAAGSTAPSSQ